MGRAHMTLESNVNVKYLKLVKICLTARNAISAFVFIEGVIFITVIVFWWVDDKRVSDNCYDLRVKGQGRIYLKPACGS